jgi:hypothetical protein
MVNSQKSNDNKYNLYIVYYINCLINPNYFDWLRHQLKYLTDQINDKNITELDKSKIFIIASLEKSKEEHFIEKLNRFYPETIFEIKFYPNNEYEYQGIKKVWELGQIYNTKNDIILYYHSKGMSRHEKYEYNKDDNYNIILKNIKEIFNIFNDFSEIDKIGYSCGGIGWIWYNFWYVRGSYINFVEKPIKTNRRHYYEDWLGRTVKNKNDIITDNERPFSFYKNTLKNCYCFHTYENLPNIGYYYDPMNNKYFKIPPG